MNHCPNCKRELTPPGGSGPIPATCCTAPNGMGCLRAQIENLEWQNNELTDLVLELDARLNALAVKPAEDVSK